MSKLIGVLAVTLAIVTYANADANATAVASCQSSGAPVDLDMPDSRDADFEELPIAVQKGMGEHQEILGIELSKQEFDCYGNFDSSWACEGDGWWCTCWRIGDKWNCGCETGDC